MKKLVKLLCCLMALLICSCFIRVSAVEVDYRKYNGFVYTDYDNFYGGVTITNYTGTKKVITVPSKIKGNKVTMINLGKKTTSAVTLKIPASVRYIRVSKAPSLKKVVINKNNKYFKVENRLVLNKKGTVVRSCAGAVTSVKIPNTVNKIYHQAFAGAKIKTVTFGEKVKTIDTYAFSNCKQLETVTMKMGLKTIGKNSFDGCKNLSKVVIENTINSPKVNDFAFNGTKAGIVFQVKNDSVANQLKSELEGSGVVGAKIYVGENLVY